MKSDRLSYQLTMLESLRERYLDKEHPNWANAAFDDASIILQDVHHYGADQYEMLVYIWKIINEVYYAERWGGILPLKEEDDK